jgi:hypothetical protein
MKIKKLILIILSILLLGVVIYSTVAKYQHLAQIDRLTVDDIRGTDLYTYPIKEQPLQQSNDASKTNEPSQASAKRKPSLVVAMDVPKALRSIRNFPGGADLYLTIPLGLAVIHNDLAAALKIIKMQAHNTKLKDDYHTMRMRCWFYPKGLDLSEEKKQAEPMSDWPLVHRGPAALGQIFLTGNGGVFHHHLEGGIVDGDMLYPSGQRCYFLIPTPAIIENQMRKRSEYVAFVEQLIKLLNLRIIDADSGEVYAK